MRAAAKAGRNSLTNAMSIAATDTYGDKAVVKSKPSFGSFSMVASHDDKSVLKVYHDPAYSDFIQYAKANQHDPHMPRIYSHTTTPDGIGLVRMEKLHDYHSGSHALKLPPYDGAEGSGNYHEFHQDNDALWQARTGAGLHMLLHDVPGRAMMTHNPSFHKSLSNLAKTFPHKAMDLHPGNLMKRGDGTTVITDPFWDEHHYIAKNDAGKLLKEMMTFNKHPLKDTLTNPGSRPYSNHLLGKGNYASVYDRGKHNSVIKVYKQDAGYEDFLSYAKAHQDNPHMPKIYAHKRLPNGGGVLRMERLQERPTDETVAKKFSSPDGGSHDWLVGKNIQEPLNARMDNMAKNFPSLHKTIYHMEHTSEHEHEWDIGSFHDAKNVMYRDNTPVLSDPWYSRGRPKNPKADELDEMVTLNRLSINKDDPDTMAANEHGPRGHFADIRRHYNVDDLGQGISGAVFPHKKPDKVVKVYSKWDTNYDKVADYSKANPDDPHFPKIYARGTLKTGHKIQTMEKLQPISSSASPNTFHSMRLVQNVLGRSVGQAHYDFENNGVATQKLKEHDPVLHDSVRKFVKHLYDTGHHDHYFDSHNGNFMERPSTKHLVMTDIFESKEPVNEMMTLNRHPLVSNIKSLNTPDWHDQGEALHDEIGMKINQQSLGRGFRGVAYSHKDHVIKVYRHDPAYHDFVKYALKNQDDPHMPKIYAHKVIDPEKHMGVVKMERLGSALGDLENDSLHYTTKYAERIYHENHIPGFMSQTHEKFKQDYPTLHASLQKLAADPEVNKHVTPTALGDFHHKFDIHPGNIMKRPSTGHLVLLDPLI